MVNEIPTSSQGVDYDAWKSCVLRNFEKKQSSLSALIQENHHRLTPDQSSADTKKKAFWVLSHLLSDDQSDHFQKVASQYGQSHCIVLSQWYASLYASLCD